MKRLNLNPTNKKGYRDRKKKKKNSSGREV